MSPQRVACVVLLVGALAAVLAVAMPAAAGSPRRIVEIHVEGDSGTLERVRAAAAELLPEISITPVVVAASEPGAPDEPRAAPFVSAYFDFRDSPATIVIVDGSSRRELDRRRLPPGTTLEAAVESAVHVLFMLVESMLDEQAAPRSEPASASSRAEHDAPGAALQPEGSAARSGTARLDATARATPSHDTANSDPHARRKVEPRVGLGAALLARVLYFGAGQMLPSGGVQIELDFPRAQPRFGAAWYFVASAPFVLSTSDASAKLYPFSSGLLPNVEFDLGADFSAVVGGGVVLTWFSLNSSGPARAAVGHSTGGVDTALTGALGLRAQTGTRFSLMLLGALDYDLEPRSFVALDGDGRHVLGALAQWRPSLSFVVAYSLIGGTARATATEPD